MVNEEKVRIMTQIALDETKNHKKEINEGEYYKSDYVRSHIVSVLWNITVSYALIVCLIALYYADYIFINVARMDYERIGFILLGIYTVLVILSILLSYLFFSKKYVINRKKLEEYFKKLEQLDEFYTQSKEGAENDTTTGA